MSEENPKYLSAYTGAQIDKAYKTVSNIQPSGSGKLVMINSNGELVASPYSSGETANKPINWSVATLQNFIQYAGAGETKVSDYNANSFMRSVAIAVDNNVPTFYKQGNIVCLQDSGVSISSIQEALNNIGTVSNNEIVSGSVNTTYPESLILTKKNEEVINIDLAQFTALFQKKITVSNKLNADLVYNGINNIFLTPGDQSITGNKTFTGSTRFDFGNEDYVYLQQSSYYFGHTNGENKTYVNIQPAKLDVSYVNANNDEQYVDLSLNSIDKSFRVSSESGNYISYILLNPTQMVRQNENTSSEFYSRESATPTSYQIYLNNPIYEKSYQLNASSNGIGIYADCDNYDAPSGTGHHVGSMVVSYENYAQLYGYDNTNDDDAHVKVDYKSYEIAADNDDLGVGSKISGDKDIIRLRIYDEDGDLKNVTINSTGAYIDNKEIAVKEDITTEVDSAISDLVDVLQTSLTSDLIIAAQIKAKADAAYRSSASGIKLVEDANKFNIYHEPVTVSGALKSKGYELKSDASYVTLKNTTDNTSISLGSDVKLGDSQHGLQFFSNTGQFVLGTSNLTAIFGSGRLSVDDSNINYQIASKSKIYADSSNVILNNNLTDHSKLSLTNNASILSYTNVNNIANQIKVDNDGVEISLGGTAVQKANFVRSSNGTEIILDNQYKVLTDRDFGYLDLTGNIDVYDPTSGVITNGVFYDDGGTLREAYYADPNGILSPEQLIEVRKQSCIIYVSGRYFIKCTDGNFYSFRTPYNYNNQVTREGVIYNYTSQKWKVDVLTITGNTYTISVTELDMMDFTQTKKLVDETVAVLNQALTGVLQRIQTLENTVSSFESRITALENASANYARIRQH